MTKDTDLNTFAEVPSENTCVRYEDCGNVVPENGRMCGRCLDEVRAADRVGERSEVG